MTTTRRKPDLQAQFMEAEPENCKGWRNINFTSTGRTIYGIYLHETKQDAAVKANESISVLTEVLRIDGLYFWNHVVISKEDLPITVIQIPEA